MSVNTYYRKYRPDTEETFLGNSNAKLALRSLSEKAKRDKTELAQNLLIKGATGCGKTSLSRLISKIYACAGTAEERGDKLFCGRCENCLRMDEYLKTGQDYDKPMFIHEYNSAKLNSADVNDLITAMQQDDVAYYDSWSVYIFDEAHLLTDKSMGNLLKFFEEPPNYIAIILCTNEPEQLLPTLVNRSVLDLEVSPPTDVELLQLMQRISISEGFSYDLQALKLIIRKAERIPRQCLSYLENIVSQTGHVSYGDTVRILHETHDEYYVNFLRALKNDNFLEYMVFLGKLYQKYDLKQYIRNFFSFLDRMILIYNGIDKSADGSEREVAKLILGELYSTKEIVALYESLKEMQLMESTQIRLELYKLGVQKLLPEETKRVEEGTKEDIAREQEVEQKETEKGSLKAEERTEFLANLTQKQYLDETEHKVLMEGVMKPITFDEIRQKKAMTNGLSKLL